MCENRQNRDLSYQDVSMLCSLFEQNARSDARTELEETHHFYRSLLSFVSIESSLPHFFNIIFAQIKRDTSKQPNPFLFLTK